jgi:proteasome lid subunit RPN8/RPN11
VPHDRADDALAVLEALRPGSRTVAVGEFEIDDDPARVDRVSHADGMCVLSGAARIVGPVLVIRADLVDEIVAHARRDHPDEACGVVAGPEGSDRPERFIPMLNAARSPTFYEFDSGDLLRLYRDMDSRDEVPVVVYHSHTATEAYPSRTDIGLAQEPHAHYVLVSTREEAETNETGHEFRSFRIVDGVVTEEQVAVVETYMFAHTGADDVPDLG